MTLPIDGYCDPAFENVKTAFIDNFTHREELGASFCLYAGGQKVIDIWGGYTDRHKTQNWQDNTISVVFSCTKAAVALCAHILIDRGELELDARVTRYWPEFGQAGKEDVTVRMMLTHQSGLPALRAPVKSGGFYDFDYMVERLAAEAPFWEPGTDNGYHMITFGWTVGELIRRVSGKSLGQFFKDEIAVPLDLDFHIGLSDTDFERTAKMVTYKVDPTAQPSEFVTTLLSDKTSIPFLAMFNTGQHFFDHPKAWRAEIGGGGGITNARGLAAMYAPLLSEERYLSAARISDMGKPASETARDQTLLIPTRFAQGFMLSMDNRSRVPGEGHSAVLGPHAFGHVGMGGSIGFCDPEHGLACGYTMNKMGGGILLGKRGQSLVNAVYAAIGAPLA